MRRLPRADVAGELNHSLNRGNTRQTIFHKDADYEAFERVLFEGLEKYAVDLYSDQWMPNHWHMVLSPRQDRELRRLLYWATMTYTARHHAHYHTTGFGDLHQGRSRAFPSRATSTS
jgi:putative transposase